MKEEILQSMEVSRAKLQDSECREVLNEMISAEIHFQNKY